MESRETIWQEAVEKPSEDWSPRERRIDISQEEQTLNSRVRI